jgi:long-chain acyl-CoA synthetase
MHETMVQKVLDIKNLVAEIEADEASLGCAPSRASRSAIDAGLQGARRELSKRQAQRNLGLLGVEHSAGNESKTAIINIRANGSVSETSYGEFHANVCRAAQLLQSAGLQPGDRLAIAIGNRIEFLIAVFGALRAGITAVPLSIKLGSDALSFILRDAACKAALADTELPATLVMPLRSVDGPRWTIASAGEGWESFDTTLASQPREFAAPALNEGHLAMITYTAGSTGVPKGVPLTHAGQIWLAETMQHLLPKVMTREARAMVAVPLFHKNALAVAVKPMMHCGGSMVIMEEFQPRAVLESIARYRCTYSTGVPAMYALLLREQELIASLDLSQFQTVIIGSAPCAPELLRAIETQLSVDVVQGYGLTECAPVLVAQRNGGHRPPLESCGRPVPGVDVRLVAGSGTADADEGELWVRGPNLTPGYLNRPDLNAQRFQNGWLKTGDLFYRDADGYYFFRGRTDDMFFCGGENIYPLEVENILMRHLDVSNVAVVALDDAVKGQIPAALVTLKPGKNVTADELTAFYLRNGPAFSHPRIIRIVEQLPLSGAGKVDRPAVRNALLVSAATSGSVDEKTRNAHD